MHTARCVSVLLMAFMAVPAVAGEGLKVNPASSFWSGEGSNIRLNALWVATAPSIGQRWAGMGDTSPAGAAVVGDYYFSAATPAQRLNRSGFRASSGLLIKQPGVSLSELAWSSRAAATFGTPAHLQLSTAIGSLEPSADTYTYTYSTMPYVGIGYSGIHAKSGWGFWADVGLVMQNPGNMLGVRRVMSGSQSAEDLVRELRLSPLLQLGVNYSF